MPPTFGSSLRELRKAKNYTQRELAAKAGIDFTYLSKIENDLPGYQPSEEVIRTLAELLSTDPEGLVLLAKRIPKTIQKRMASNPQAAEFLRDAGSLSEQDWERILRIVRKKK